MWQYGKTMEAGRNVKDQIPKTTDSKGFDSAQKDKG